jgi:acyl-coenzyme A synthetase/AMP-(fatty) acid ligase
VGQEWQEEWKTSFFQRTKKNVIVNVISEMKQTAALMLGIIRLGAIFVQMNEIMGLNYSVLR